MARWPAGARDRLQRAAIELIAAQGYDRTTVAEIAGHAELTERTFYNYFADKREAVFAGQDEFVAVVVEAVHAQPLDRAPMDTATAALAATSEWFDQRREPALLRQRVIDAHPELQERELSKLAGLSTAIARALQDRGIPTSDATLVAAAGVAAFQVAFAQWIDDPGAGDLAERIRSAVNDLRSLTSG